MHPEHFFIVKRDFGPKIGWGYLGEDAKTFADCTDAIIESFDGCDVMLNADTVLVLEIDGGVALNRKQAETMRQYRGKLTMQSPHQTVTLKAEMADLESKLSPDIARFFWRAVSAQNATEIGVYDVQRSSRRLDQGGGPREHHAERTARGG